MLIPVTWVGGSDNWIEPGSWAPEPLDIDNIFLLWPDNTLSSNYFSVIVPNGQITLDTPVSVTSLTIDNSAELRISNIGALTLELFGLSGSLTQNEGRIRISDSGSLKTLSLTGGGEVVMSDSAQVNGLSLNAGGQTIRGAGVINSIFNLDALVNAGTLSGDVAGGTLRVAGVGLVNQGTSMATSGGRLKIETPFLTNGGLVDADAGAVAIDVGTFTNSGTVRARNGGSVRYASITADGAGGLVEVLSGSRLSVETSILNGGLFRTSGTGLVHFDEGDSRLTGSPVLEGSLLIDTGTLDIRDAAVNATLATLTATAATVTVRNSTLHSGTYAGAGAFTVMSPSVLSGTPNPATIDTAEFAIPGGKSLQLMGEIRLNNGGRIGTSAVGSNVAADLWCNGPVLLSGNGGAVVFSPVGTNSGNRLLGMNSGVLTTGVNTSLLAPTAAVGSVYLPLVNHGTVAATGGFIEIINTTITNDGLIVSSNGGRVQVGQYAAPTEINNTGGTLRAGAGGSITFSGSVSQIPGITTIRGGTLDGTGTFTNQRYTTLDGATHGAVTLRDAIFVTPGNTRTTALGTLLFDGGTLRFADENNLVGSIDASLSVAGPVLLGGTGTLDFSHAGFGPYHNSIEGADAAALLTIGPGITVRADSLNDVGSFTTDTVHQGQTHASNGGLIQFVNVSTTNTGIIEASASGRVQIGRANLPTTLNNTGGTLRASAGGSITFSGSVSQIPGITTIRGGTLDGTGTFTNQRYTTLDGATNGAVTLRDAVFVTPGNTRTTALGTLLFDNGTLRFADENNLVGSIDASLSVAGLVLLGGTGTLDFSHTGFGPYNNSIEGADAAALLTIGPGITVRADSLNDVGSFTMDTVHQGHTHASNGGLIQFVNVSTTNTGIIEASVGGQVQIGRANLPTTLNNTGGTLRASAGGSITFSGSVSQIPGVTTVQGGTIDGTGVVFSGPYSILDGHTSEPVTLRGTTLRILDGQLHLAGTITLDGAGIELQDNRFGLGSGVSRLRTDNDATVNGTGMIRFLAGNEGGQPETLVETPSGSLTIGSGVTVLATAGAQGSLSGTYFNAGTIHAQGGSISLGVTSLQNTGTIRTSTGGSIIAGRSGAAALFDNAGGTFWAATGTDIAFPFSQTIARGGVYQGLGTFTAGSSVQLDGTTSGPVTLRDTSFRVFNHSVLNLAGTITLENATLLLQDRQYQLGTRAILRTGNDVTIAGEGTIELAQNSEGNASENWIDIAAGSLTISQGVALRIPAGSGSLISGGPLTIQGLFQCDAVGGSDPANLIYAPVTIAPTGTLAGSGTFLLYNGMTVYGTVSPGASPGILTVERFFPGVASVYTPAAKLLFEIGGTTPGTQHDVLKVSGYLNLGGAMLRPRFINHFQNSITPANTFTVIETLLPIIGSFSNVFNGRVMAADGSGTFSVTFAANGTRVVLGDFIAGAVIDSDGDGMSDEFEQQYFGSPTAGDPAVDSDGDGQTNLQEYRAGTNPVDPASVFRIKEIRRQGDDIVIIFEAAADKGYELLAGANLTDGFPTLIQTLAPTPTGGIRTVTDSGAAATHPRRFYRAQVVP